MRARVLALAVLLSACGGSDAPAPPADTVTRAQRDGARRYLAATLAPLPDGWRAGRFAPEPGVSLETASVPARGARRGTVVFVPGYTAPIELYTEELGRLADAGWDVAAIAQRGQARSTRSGGAYDMGHLSDYDDAVSDLAAFVATQAGPVAVMGVSMGGHSALRLAARAPDVAAYVAVVPMVEVALDPMPDALARAIAGAAGLLGQGRRYVPGTGAWDGAARFTDPDRLAEDTPCSPVPERAHLRDALFTLDPALRIDAPSLGWIAATLRSQRALAAEGPSIAAPVLMVTAGADRIVRNAPAAALCDAMGACERLHLPDAPHCILEGDREIAASVIDAALAFLAREVATLADQPITVSEPAASR